MSTASERLNGRGAVLTLCALAGAAYLAIGLARSEYWLAFGGAGVMVGYAALLVAFGNRSEPVALLGGKQSDERHALVMQRATAATAHVLVAVLVAAAMISLATGSHYAGVFCALCGVAGVAFVAATVWYSRRG